MAALVPPFLRLPSPLVTPVCSLPAFPACASVSNSIPTWRIFRLQLRDRSFQVPRVAFQVQKHSVTIVTATEVQNVVALLTKSTTNRHQSDSGRIVPINC